MLKKIIENPTWLKDHKINLGAKYLTLIHGDLTLENILVGNDDKLKFIDPLSAMMDPSAFINFNLERTKTSPVFDLIKLLQSIDVGYEVWSKMQNVAGVDVNANISFRSELITSSSKVRETIIDYYSTLGVNVNQVNLNFLLALQLFRIIPYKLQAEIDKAWYCFAVATTLIDGIN
jgi:predicted trehalose synthase